MTSVEKLSSIVLENIKCQHLFIKDFSNCGCGQKFELHIVSSDFEGQSRIQRHKHVQELLKSEIEKLHAITFKLYTPEQYEEKKGEIPSDLVDLVPQQE